MQTFLNIERSRELAEDAPLVVSRPRQNRWLPILGCDDETQTYSSIGLFYAEVIRGLEELYEQMGEAIFCGDRNKQITREYYYDGAGEIVPVYGIKCAKRALMVIQEQGEGTRHEAIYDAERELCHYYRFQQLQLGQYYAIDKKNPLNSDSPDRPTGNTFSVDWDAVYPVKTNAKLSDYPESSELYKEAQSFQQQYNAFLGMIQASFNGNPGLLIRAVGEMFKLKESADRLIRKPIPGMDGVNAAPIFRLD